MTTIIPENIGQFYLGTESFPNSNTPILYDAADLTTHAVIIGMTGSGKTGLGICLLEEAALDHIPVIAIDPKGDLGNLALIFPEFKDSDFLPYADPAVLAQKGETAEQWANSTAASWKSGIEKTQQTTERMHALKASNPIHIYTPGSQTGIPLSLLSNLSPPDEALRADAESYAQYLDATVGGLLALLKMTADSMAPEHVFLTQVLKHSWDESKTLSIAELIGQIQNPPFNKIGVLPVTQVYADKDRQKLAMALNNFLASPSFSGWRVGESLNTEALFYDSNKQAQTSVLNISGLNDAERMFFLTLFLNNLIAWMRRQQGTATLRAILYMDEVAGYLPPNGNPPSKILLLTLLKQARAFGLGLVLSTQNPVDLDYKALSNAGTWLIGRLQTAQDRARVTEGLLSAGEKGISKNELDNWFDKLGKRQFLLHNVHKDAPCIFSTRWTMSYLAGPLNKTQIMALTEKEKASFNQTSSLDDSKNTVNTAAAIVPTGVNTYFLPSKNTAQSATHYFPSILGSASLFFSDSKSGIRKEQQILVNCAFNGDDINWSQAETADVSVEQLQTEPHQPAIFHPTPASVQDSNAWKKWEADFKTYLRQHQSISVLFCEAIKAYSEVGEDETTFRNRIATDLREARDTQMTSLRQKYATKQMTLQRQITTAEGGVSRKSSQSSDSLISAGLSIGSALIGAFTGRKVLSSSNISKATSAFNRVSKVGRDHKDVAAAENKLTLLQEQMGQLQTELTTELEKLNQDFDSKSVALSKAEINVKSTDITIRFVALGYQSLNG